MFDKERGISGEHPEHISFIKDRAIPQFEDWGYKVHVVRGDMDYIKQFNHIVTRSKVPERNGKKQGFLIAGLCYLNRPAKTRPLDRFIKTHGGDNAVQYVGIAADEPKRLARLEGTNRKSLLAEYGYTEQMAYDLCKEYDLLSPIYEHTNRGAVGFAQTLHWGNLCILK